MKPTVLDEKGYLKQEVKLEVQISNHQTSLISTVGFWTAVALASLNVIYIVLVLVAQITDTSDLQLLSALPIVMALPIFLALLACLHYYVVETKKLLTTLALVFGSIYSGFWGFTYLIQLTVIRVNITKTQYEQFALFDLQNRGAIVTVTDVSGYFFLGLTLLSVASALNPKSGRLERWIQRFFIAGGVAGFMTIFGYLTDLETLRYLAEAAFCPLLLSSAIGLILLFGRLRGINIESR